MYKEMVFLYIQIPHVSVCLKIHSENHLQVGFTSLQAWWNEDAEMDGDDVAGSRLGYVFMFTYVWWCVRLDYEYTLHEKLYNLIK